MLFRSAFGIVSDLISVHARKNIFGYRMMVWAIVLDGCVRQLWIEQNGDRRILRAKVSVRGFTLTADLKSD